MNLLADYLDNSSIHGFRYIGDKTRPWFERIFWIVIFLISFFGCCKLIFDVHQKFDQNPVIVTFDEKPTTISEIPFPAVTICPETKAQKKIFDVTAMFNNVMDPNFRLYNLSHSDVAKVVALSQVCSEKVFRPLDPKNKTDCSECVRSLREIGKPKEDMFVLCDFAKESTSCEDLFEESVTDEGICYTFNNEREGFTPRRVKGAGNEFSLELTLELCEENFDYMCRGPSQGFKALLHNPGEVPQLKNNFYRVPLRKELIIAIKPQMLTTTEGLRQYPPEKRQCFFNSEKQLQFYDVYTERNCKLECLANFTLEKCGCVKFFMPRLAGTKICGISDINCSHSAFRYRHYLEVIHDLEKLANPYGCNCLPACTSITYDAEISQTDSYVEEYYKALKQEGHRRDGCQQTRISMFFKEENFLSTKRSELYGRTDFLANCGGLLGLFMGVSIMSILEIVYFCTVRLVCNLMRQHNSEIPNEKIFFIN